MAKENHSGRKRDSRREERRRRRIRNQIIAYLVLVLLVIGIFAGGYFGIRFLIAHFKTGNQQIITSNNQIADSETAEGSGVISTPEEMISENEAPVQDPVDPLQEEIAAYISSMTLEQKVANLFVVTPESITGVTTATQAGDGTRAALGEYAVGGIVYSARNVQSADQFKEMITNTKNMYRELYNQELWVIVREEGAVNVIAGSATGVTAQQPAGEIGTSGDTGNAYQAYMAIGAYLNEYGVDVNLGPVCDVPTEGSYLGERAFNTDADIVTSMVPSAVNGQSDFGIITCLTAFPGQGSLNGDPANGTATTEKTLDEMRSFDFLPFSSGIVAGAQMVMVSNMTAAEETVPCSLSSVIITDILRGELGFQGVVITADLDQKAITNHYTSGEAAVMALQAGADMIMKPANVAEAYAAVLAAVADGTLTEERIDESLTRIYTIKMAD
ncbi:MAG: beta-N-acetylhexosaminidase [Lachnospiraceae bacterium]|nr:beta-N-acetylhexosaminidase [Lachnospiraceae bacterium]